MSETEPLIHVMAMAYYRERHRRGADTTPSWDAMKAVAQDRYRHKARVVLMAMIDAGYGIAPPGIFLTRQGK